MGFVLGSGKIYAVSLNGYLIVCSATSGNVEHFKKIGDTITSKQDPASEPLEGFEEVLPMVFSGIYPIDTADYETLKYSMGKLQLNDPSFLYQAESSAALLVYKDAFERANSFDREKVRDALAKTDMQTFYGNIKFSDTGQNIAKPMVLFQVRCEGDECANKVVAPTKWASEKLVHPIPKWSER